jgi:hypothetical protein
MAGKNVTDPELKAMAVIAEALDDLTVPTRYRVVEWLNGRYGPDGPPVASFDGGPKVPVGQSDGRVVEAHP